MYKSLGLTAAGALVAAIGFASPSVAAHCGILTGAQICITGMPTPAEVALAGPFEQGTTDNDSVIGDFPQYQVNQDMLLGNSTWGFGGRFDFGDNAPETDDTDFDSGLSVIGDSIMGSFSVSGSLFDRFRDVMVVLSVADEDETGDDPNVPNYYGYLLTEANGDYNGANPFPDTPLDHLSVYAAPIPVPAALPLVLTGLGTLAFAARRRKKAAA